MKFAGTRVVFVTLLLTALFFATPAFAQRARSSNSFGLGIGAATIAAGLSFKTQTSRGFAFQGVVGTWRGHGRHWRFGGNSLGLGADFLYEMPSFARGRIVSVAWNYGLGVGVGLDNWDGALLGGTGVLGLEFDFVAAPFDFVLEYRPGLYFTDGFLGVEPIDATAHLRIWF